MLNCYFKDCDDYLPPPKEDLPGICGRIQKGLPICIGPLVFKLTIDGNTKHRMKFPACLFYRTLTSKAKKE